MVRGTMRMMAAAMCLAGVSCLGSPPPNDPAQDATMIEGLWHGSWGGGVTEDGVGFQPVIAEMLIKGDHVELVGFPKVGNLTGTVRFDAANKQMQITPAAAPGVQPAPRSISYTYSIQGDLLTLVDRDQLSISLESQPVAKNPLANVSLELFAADGINDAGDLLVTEFTELKVGRAGETRFRPLHRALKTTQATVLLVQDSGVKKVNLEEARGLVRPATQVAVTYRRDDRPLPYQPHKLWEEIGPPPPDGEAVARTLARLLRPGTLVFILSARENIPLP